MWLMLWRIPYRPIARAVGSCVLKAIFPNMRQLNCAPCADPSKRNKDHSHAGYELYLPHLPLGYGCLNVLHFHSLIELGEAVAGNL